MSSQSTRNAPPVGAEHIDYAALWRAQQRAMSTYKQAAVVQASVADHLLQRLQLLPQTIKRVLELGAADGAMSLKLKQQWPEAHCTAVDQHADMLKQAASWWSASGVEHVVADVNDLPPPEQPYDLVISNLLLHWLPDPAAALQHWRQQLAPGGVLLFSTLGPDSLCELKQAFSGIDNASHVHDFIDMHWYGDWLLAAGYEEPVVDVEMLSLSYQSLQRLCLDLKQTGSQCALYNRLRSLCGKGAWQQMQRNYAALCDEDGRYPVTLEVIFGFAVAPDNDSPRQQQGADGEVMLPISAVEGVQRS